MCDAKNHKQSGTAIFMSLLVVSLVTALSIIWFAQTRSNVRRTQEMLIASQTYLYAQGVIAWGVSALKINDNMPKILPKTSIGPNLGMITGKLDSFPPKMTDKVSAKKAMASAPKEYFLLRSEVHFSKQQLIIYSLLHRANVKGKIEITIIWQSHGLI